MRIGRSSLVSAWTLVSFLLASSQRAVAADILKTFTLYDSWNGQEDFRQRGQVSLGVQESGEVELTLADQASPPAFTSREGFYTLKMVDDSNPSTYAMTSVSACQLLRANYRDEFTLTLGPSGSIISLAYVPLVSPLAPLCNELSDDDTTAASDKSFVSKILYETSTPGMTLPILLPHSKPPPGLKFFPRTASTTGGGSSFPGDKTEEAPQSFFRRYWHVIAIFLVVNMLSGGGEAPAPQQQQQGDSAGAAPSAGSAPAATATAPSPSGGGTRRRGKRG